MPDLAMCNSTVCSVRKNCERNWDARVHESDRDPKLQEWAGQPYGVGHNTYRKDGSHDLRAHDVTCDYYLRIAPHYRPEYVPGRSRELGEVKLTGMLTADMRGQAIRMLTLYHLGEERDDVPADAPEALVKALERLHAGLLAEQSRKVTVGTSGQVFVDY